ncbi:MAG: right-handed parallel beta-helix repeat-containing protein [bacterium]|nr:right-handed parallel beta-helix repeat-containing protein [bacterium]
MSSLRRLAIVNVPQNGILINGPGGNVIQANYIGLKTDGASSGMNENGIHINGSPDNRIGRSGANDRNVIADNGKAGASGANVTISGTDSAGNMVQGNYIGTDPLGLEDRAACNGVQIEGGAHDNQIGDASAGIGNLISGNAQGIQLLGLGTAANRIQGNVIGLTAGAAAKLPNSGYGIQIFDDADGNLVGGPAGTPGAAPGNVTWAMPPAASGSTPTGDRSGQRDWDQRRRSCRVGQRSKRQPDFQGQHQHHWRGRRHDAQRHLRQRRGRRARERCRRAQRHPQQPDRNRSGGRRAAA